MADSITTKELNENNALNKVKEQDPLKDLSTENQRFEESYRVKKPLDSAPTYFPKSWYEQEAYYNDVLYKYINNAWVAITSGSNVETLPAGETMTGATTPQAVFDNGGGMIESDADTAPRQRFQGFAISDDSGGTVNVQLDGVVSGFTGLTTGSVYYLQNDGTIGTSPGGTTIIVGFAISATQLKIEKDINYI